MFVLRNIYICDMCYYECIFFWLILFLFMFRVFINNYYFFMFMNNFIFFVDWFNWWFYFYVLNFFKDYGVLYYLKWYVIWLWFKLYGDNFIVILFFGKIWMKFIWILLEMWVNMICLFFNFILNIVFGNVLRMVFLILIILFLVI